MNVPSFFVAIRITLVSLVVAFVACVAAPFSVAADGVPASVMPTVSYYESTVDASTMASQGDAAGQAGSQGLVILDFGRPAVSESIPGTVDFQGSFVSLSSIVAATVSYIQAYLASAPANLRLHLAIGTNDSCGAGQPCGGIVCGCTFEPPSFTSWGAELAAAVEQAQSEANTIKNQAGDTDVVTVVAGDDAEPAFDPGYQNTHDLLEGYANAVQGFLPAMIDFGSAEPGYWSNEQLLQVVAGFEPDVAVPEVYTDSEAGSWASLISFAAERGKTVPVFGVLTDASTGDSPQAGYSASMNVIAPVTGQTSISWTSQISP